MSIYSLKETPDDDPILDNPEYDDLQDEIRTLELELFEEQIINKKLEEEIAWLRYTLDRFGLIGKADDEFKKLVGVN